MAELHQFYKDTRETARIQGKITIERLRTSGEWPKLKAKAAATRHCAKFALHLAAKHCDGSDHELRRLGVAQCLNDFYNLIEEEGQFLSDSARRRLPQIGFDLGNMYAQLATEAKHNSRKLWKCNPKLIF